MPLIDKPYIKQNFPQWEFYAENDPVAVDTDAALDRQIENAEDEFAEYVTVTDATITDSLKRHLFKIVRYLLFMLDKGDTEFERDPQIVYEYKHTIKMLEALRDGERPATPAEPSASQGTIKMTAKRRQMNSWRTDIGHDTVSTEDA